MWCLLYPLCTELWHSNWLLEMHDNECEPMFITFLVALGVFLLLAVRKPCRVPIGDRFRGVARHRTFCDHVHPISRDFHAQGSTRLRRCDPVRSDRSSTVAKRPTERRASGCRRVSLIGTKLVTEVGGVDPSIGGTRRPNRFASPSPLLNFRSGYSPVSDRKSLPAANSDGNHKRQSAEKASS